MIFNNGAFFCFDSCFERIEQLLWSCAIDLAKYAIDLKKKSSLEQQRLWPWCNSTSVDREVVSSTLEGRVYVWGPNLVLPALHVHSFVANVENTKTSKKKASSVGKQSVDESWRAWGTLNPQPARGEKKCHARAGVSIPTDSVIMSRAILYRDVNVGSQSQRARVGFPGWLAECVTRSMSFRFPTFIFLQNFQFSLLRFNPPPLVLFWVVVAFSAFKFFFFFFASRSRTFRPTEVLWAGGVCNKYPQKWERRGPRLWTANLIFEWWKNRPAVRREKKWCMTGAFRETSLAPFLVHSRSRPTSNRFQQNKIKKLN